MKRHVRQRVKESEAGTLKLWSSILWPSFIVAIAANGLFFSVFDPIGLLIQVDEAWSDLPMIAIYTIGFFLCWAFCAMASILTCFLVTIPRNR